MKRSFESIKHTTSNLDQIWLLGVFLIILLAAALRLATLPYLSFYSDEVWTVRFSTYPLSYIMSHMETGLSMHLYILFTKVLTQFVGDSVIGLKAPSLIAGILTIPAVYLMTKRLLDRQVAILAMLLAAFNPFLIEFSRYARVYAILTLVTIFIMLLYYRTLRQQETKYFIWLGVANGIGLMLSGTAAYVLLIQGCSVLIETLLVQRKRDWKLFWSFSGSFLLSLILGSLFYIAIIIQIPFMVAYWAGGIQGWQLGAYIAALQRLHPYITPVMLLLLLVGCWVALKRYRTAGRLLVLWGILPILFFFIMGARHTDLAIARFLILTVPAHFALMSLGLLDIIRRLVPNYPVLAAGAFIVTLVVGTWVFSPGNTLQSITAEPHGASVVAARLKEIVQDDDIMFADPDYMQYVLRNQLDVIYIPLNELTGKQIDTIESYTGQGRLVIVTFNDPSAQEVWSRYFTTEVISGSHYIYELVILTSPKIVNDADLREALLVYFTGSLEGIDREPWYLALPGRLYNRLAWTHHSLGFLKLPDQLDEEIAEHQQLADKYWELGKQESNIKR